MKKWFQMKKRGKSKLEIMIYDVIGGWGISAKDFIKELKNNISGVKTLHLKINSPGGSVFEGNAIYNELVKLQGVKIMATIDGFAASMASVIAMAADYVIMPENTFLMIHNPMVMAGGDAKQLKKYAKLLEDIKVSAIKAYQKHAKDMSEEDVSKLMDDETWLTAQEAFDYGFIEMVDEARDPDQTPEEHNFENLKNVPANVYATLLGCDPQNPFPNEHACRLQDPGKYSKFRRIKRDSASQGGKQYSVIQGFLSEDDKWEEQAYRYPKKSWSEASAKAHCKAHGGTFEAATNKGGWCDKSSSVDDLDDFFGDTQENINSLNLEEVLVMKVGFNKKGDLIDEESGKVIKTAEQFKQEGIDTLKLIENPSEKEQEEARQAALIEAQANATENEKKRQKGIRDLGAALNIKNEEIEKAINENIAVEAASTKFVEMHAAELQSGGGAGSILITAEQAEKEQEGLVNALLVRGGVETDPKKVAENRTSEFAGFGLQSIVKHFLERAGAKRVATMSASDVGQGFLDLVYGTNQIVPRNAMSMNTNDLESALSTVNSIALLKAYEVAQTTYQMVSRPGTLPDLKQAELYKLSEGPNILEIPEGQPPKLSRVSDRRETVQLNKYGRAWSVTEEMIINDRLDVITKMPEKYGRSLAHEINYQYWNTLLTGNGPALNEDGTNIFTAAHGNLVAIGAGGGINQQTLAAGFTAFLNFQTFSPDGGQSRNRYLSYKPSILFVGPQRMLNANRYTASTYTPGGTNEELNLYGPQGNWKLVPAVEPLIDTYLQGAMTIGPWLLFAMPNDIDYAMILTLAGRDTPRLSSKVGGAGEVKGIIYDIVHFWVVKFPDYRGVYKNMGI